MQKKIFHIKCDLALCLAFSPNTYNYLLESGQKTDKTFKNQSRIMI
jgi:hypothetical protein